MGNYIDINDPALDNWPSGISDAQKTAAVNSAEQLIDKIIGTQFYSKTFDIQMDGNGKNRITPLLKGNILTVRKVFVFGTEIPPSWYKYDANAIMLDLDSAMNELSDGEFDDWVSATALTFWSQTLAGTSTVNREETEVNEGTYAMRFDVDALDSDVFVDQDITLQPNRQYTFSIDRFMSAAGQTAQFQIRDSGSNVWLQSDGSWGSVATWIEIANALTYTSFSLEFRANVLYSDYRITIDRKAAAGESIYFDDAKIESEEGGAVTDPELQYRLSATQRQGLFVRGHNGIRIVGTYGYSTTPQPIIDLAIILVRYDNDPTLYTTTTKNKEKIGDYAYEIGTATALKTTINEYTGIREADMIISHYIRQRKPTISAV